MQKKKISVQFRDNVPLGSANVALKLKQKHYAQLTVTLPEQIINTDVHRKEANQEEKE